MRYPALLRGLLAVTLLGLFGCTATPPESTDVGGAPQQEAVTQRTAAPPSESTDVGAIPQQEAATQRPAAPPPIVLDAGTPLEVTLDQTLSSGTNAPGDTFDASLAAPVVVGDTVVIPSGARASGTIAETDTAGRVRGSAAVAMQLDSITVAGRTYKIQTAAVEETGGSRGKRTATGTGLGAAAGAVIGAIAGGGKGAAIGAGAGAGAGTAGAVLTGERDITLPAETRVRFVLSAPVSIPAR